MLWFIDAWGCVQMQGDVKTYYAELLKICARADAPGRPELAEARKVTGTK